MPTPWGISLYLGETWCENAHFSRSDDDDEVVDVEEKNDKTENDDKLYLNFYEAFFLAFGLGCLIVKENDLDLSLGMMSKMKLLSSKFKIKFDIY